MGALSISCHGMEPAMLGVGVYSAASLISPQIQRLN